MCCLFSFFTSFLQFKAQGHQSESRGTVWSLLWRQAPPTDGGCEKKRQGGGVGCRKTSPLHLPESTKSCSQSRGQAGGDSAGHSLSQRRGRLSFGSSSCTGSRRWKLLCSRARSWSSEHWKCIGPLLSVLLYLLIELGPKCDFSGSCS